MSAGGRGQCFALTTICAGQFSTLFRIFECVRAAGLMNATSAGGRDLEPIKGDCATVRSWFSVGPLKC